MDTIQAFGNYRFNWKLDRNLLYTSLNCIPHGDVIIILTTTRVVSI